jgi:glycosyltransferase involved in cell wall biosynthesis
MTHQATPLITIIIAVLNGTKTLQQCIDSVANQTYSNIELIIIDGDSKDGTVILLKANQKKISYWISEPDKGIYNAWNKGLIHATGDWICFLGADDYLWDDRVLECVVKTLIALPDNIQVAYGQVMLLTKDDQPLYPVGKSWNQVKRLFVKFMAIPHQGMMQRRSLFEKNGNFDESFRIVGDYEFLLRELRKGDAAFVPTIIVGVRQGGISCNTGHSLALLREVRRAQSMHGFYIPSAVFMHAVARLIIRKVAWCLLGESRARKLLDFGRRLMGLPKYWTKT